MICDCRAEFCVMDVHSERASMGVRSCGGRLEVCETVEYFRRVLKFLHGRLYAILDAKEADTLIFVTD